ncbi:MAG: hypothetical protein ABL886_03210 [Rhodoglobus sp.]
MLHVRGPWNDAQAHQAAMSLLMVPSWEAELRHFTSVATPGRRLIRRPGMIPAKRVRDEVGDALRNNDATIVGLSSGRAVDDAYRRLKWHRDTLVGPLVITHGDRPSSGQSGDAWVADVLAYADGVGACAGVVVVMADRDEVWSECSRTFVGRNGGIAHPWPEQAERMSWSNEKDMGTRYVRFPRWGTLVSHDHVAQLGGVAAIVKVVAPAVVRPLSGGVYFQLTDSVSTAMSDEAMAKQQTFTDLAAPLLPPPVSPPG